MSDNLDTNQASEDELRAEIAQYLESTYQDGAVMATRPNSGYHKRVDEFTDKLLAIIRTEKLKLLAVVRERVVGEDERLDIQSEFDKIDVPHLETDKYPGLDGVRQASRNIYRNHQRVELTKLEAEL